MAVPKHKDDEKVLEFNQYNLGINLSKSDRQLLPSELLAATNFKYNDFGDLETRQGLALVTASALPDDATVQTAAEVTIGATTYTMIVGSDHKIWYLNGSDEPTSIGTNQTADGDVQIVQFGDYAVILDGGYIKYWDGTATGLQTAYDTANSTGYILDTTEDNTYTCDTSMGLVSGDKTIIARTWTPAAGAFGGDTIKIENVTVYLAKVGSPTGNVTCTILDSDKAVLATSTTTVNSASLTTSLTLTDFTFGTTAGSTVNMAEETVYWVAINYSGGSAGNYITVGGTTATTGMWHYKDPTWTDDGTMDFMVKVSPGEVSYAPKASFGKVHSGRLYVAGDPDHTSYLWYSNANTLFDWSTENGGGYIGVLEDDAGNFPIGGIISHYYDLYIVGKQSRPYIAKLTGTSPEDYAIVPLFQQCWTDHKCLISCVNDFWFASGDGVHAMSGVTEYGDLRSFSEGDPVLAKIKSYFSTASFAGYNPVDGQYLLKMSGYSNILVCHTKHPQTDDKGRKRYPWTEYLFAGLTPTCFASWGDTFYVGCSNGNLYALTNDVNDVSTQPTYTLKSGWIEFHMLTLFMRRIAHEVDSDAAATYRISFYTNGDDSAAVAYIDKTLTDSPMGNKLAFKCGSLQWLINTLVITKPLRIKGFSIKALPLKFSPVAPVNYATPTSYAIPDAAVYTVTTSIVANYSIADDGTSNRYIYFLDPGEDNRNVTPTGTYRAGVQVVIANTTTGEGVLTFDPDGLNKDIYSGDIYAPAEFYYDGTSWHGAQGEDS